MASLECCLGVSTVTREVINLLKTESIRCFIYLVRTIKHNDEQAKLVVAVHMAMIVKEQPCLCWLNVNLCINTWRVI